MTTFGLKNDGEKWSRKKYFTIPRANQPGKFFKPKMVISKVTILVSL